LKFRYPTTLIFQQGTGERIFPKNEESYSSYPLSWEEYLLWYQNKQGVDACPLYDVIEEETPCLLVVCNEGGHIICHQLPTEQLGNILRISTTSSVNDPLTGALRKEQTKKEVENVLNKFVRFATPFSIMFIDLDHFKKVNDAHGHLVGDHVLSEMGQRIKLALRENDRLIRYGGEEFIALLHQASLPVSLKVAERIRHAAQSLPILINGKSIELTLSIGITTPEFSDTVSSIIERADKAVYKAKQNGRNRIEYL
jgi:diguanylate cyclase (GGDEF)-like protein